jgi:hypothetical protein
MTARWRRRSFDLVRWGFTSLALLAVVLHIASLRLVILWDWSSRPRRHHVVQVSDGAIYFYRADVDPLFQTGLKIRGHGSGFQFAGLGPWTFGVLRHSPFPGESVIAVTLFYPFLIGAVPAAFLWSAFFRRRRRERVGLCDDCGYDRRGIAPDAPCPECGPHSK